MAKKKKENSHGGSGRGQGRHQKYSEETETITFRCPVSKKDILRKIVNTQLQQWANEVKKTV